MSNGRSVKTFRDLVYVFRRNCKLDLFPTFNFRRRRVKFLTWSTFYTLPKRRLISSTFQLFCQFALVHHFTKLGAGEYYLEELEETVCAAEKRLRGEEPVTRWGHEIQRICFSPWCLPGAKNLSIFSWFGICSTCLMRVLKIIRGKKCWMANTLFCTFLSVFFWNWTKRSPLPLTSSEHDNRAQCLSILLFLLSGWPPMITIRPCFLCRPNSSQEKENYTEFKRNCEQAKDSTEPNSVSVSIQFTHCNCPRTVI